MRHPTGLEFHFQFSVAVRNTSVPKVRPEKAGRLIAALSRLGRSALSVSARLDLPSGLLIAIAHQGGGWVDLSSRRVRTATSD